MSQLSVPPSRRRVILKHIFVNVVLVCLLVLLGVWCYSEGKTYKLILGLFVYCIVSSVIGARLGHCLFYEW